MMSSDAAAPSSSIPEEGNKGPTGPKSTLSILKELRVGSNGFFDFYGKVWNQIMEVNRGDGILDNPMRFSLWCVLAIVGFIFLNDCQAEPMLPIFLIVIGVGRLSFQIIEEIAGSLLKDDNTSTTWKTVKDFCITALDIILICWFITGCVWLYRMPMPNMTRFPDINATSTVTEVNDALSDHLLTAEKYCAFPVYGLAVWMVVSAFTKVIGCFLIVTVTAVVLYLLPGVENVRNKDIADDEEGLLKHDGEKKAD